MIQTATSREIPRRHEDMVFEEAPLNVGQMLPVLDHTLNTAVEAMNAAPAKLQAFVREMEAKIAAGGKDIQKEAQQHVVAHKFNRRETSLAYKFLSLLTVMGLGLAACAGSVNAATPEKPIYPTAPATQTIEQPSPTVESPTQEPTAEPTLSPAERNYEWTDEEAVTVELDATEEEIQKILEESIGEFDAYFDAEASVWSEAMFLESISYLKEDAYIRLGNWEITVTGKASYLNENGEKTSITVALVVQDMVNKTEWFPPNWIFQGRTSQDFIQERFAETTTLGGGEIKPGTRIYIDFNLPNPTNQSLVIGAQHHGELPDEVYTQEMIDSYVASGDPEALNDLLIPLEVRYDPSFTPVQP